LKISSPGRIYWPKDKFTKQDLVDYYEQISTFMLPYLIDRPQNLNRFPEGIEGEHFFHKDVEQSLPNFVSTTKIHSEDVNKEITYILCQNTETLMYLGNLGCLEINPWNSRVESLDNPDFLIFDLDPTETDLKQVVKVARSLHKLLREIKISGHCKTSGQDGLHIYIPLGAKYSYEQTQQFAELIGLVLRKQLPEIVSLERTPSARKGKVYIDYLQNRRGQTTAAPYSPRPRNGLPVSTPLHWDEVNTDLDPKAFTMKNILKRIDKVGDLWKDVLGEGIDIPAALNALSESLK
jgi:bifunctional non-homologous end joining protein LigD